MITISLCMIVKDEERILERCLAPLVEIVDEMIIVDTGSTDRTKEIAHKFTDFVYDFAWTGNFSDARNFSFSKATKDYIYCADADEVIDSENVQKFLLLKKGLLPEIEIVQMYYKNQLSFNTIYNFDTELRPKLYKRLREFRFVNPIHESVLLEPVVYDSDIEIMHCPESLHASRDLQAFVKMHESKQFISKKLHHLYAKELFISGEPEDFEAAIPFFASSVADPSRDSDEILEASIILSHAYRIGNDIKSFFKYALKNVASEGCSEICYELGCYYQRQDDYDEAVIWFYNAAFETQPVLNIHYNGDFPLTRLAECYDALGNTEQADFYHTKAAEWSLEDEHTMEQN